MDISKINDAIRENRIRITEHADEEAQVDELHYEDIFNSVLYGEIIEIYAEDNPYPSCLVFGKSLAGDPIHSVWAYNEKSKWAVLVTVYKPDPYLWIGHKIRRKRK